MNTGQGSETASPENTAGRRNAQIGFGNDKSRGAKPPLRSNSRAAQERKTDTEASVRREALIDIALNLGGLAAVFAGIAIFNSLLTWLHWY
jgi:hypothetical protein